MFGSVLVGVLIGLILAALVAVVIYKVQEAFILRVEGKLHTFTQKAYQDIGDFKSAVTGAIQNSTKEMTKIIAETKGDVELMKQRWGIKTNHGHGVKTHEG